MSFIPQGKSEETVKTEKYAKSLLWIVVHMKERDDASVRLAEVKRDAIPWQSQGQALSKC